MPTPSQTFQQPWVDPNTGGTFPISCLVPFVSVNTADNLAAITVQRYASQMTYSNGYKPIQTLGTQITGAVYATIFGNAAAAVIASLNNSMLNLAINYLGGDPQFSGAQAL